MRSAIYSLIALFASSALAAEPHGADAAKTQGPVAFMWPSDRPWKAEDDNTPPCGSSAGVTNRTEFPMVNGAIALVVQDESYNISVAVSYGNDPQVNSYFAPQFSREEIKIKPGHICYSLPNYAQDGQGNQNATIQIKYTSDFFTDRNSTFYACADITYVPATQFRAQIPCFNVTSDEFVPAPNQTTRASGASSISEGLPKIAVALFALTFGALLM